MKLPRAADALQEHLTESQWDAVRLAALLALVGAVALSGWHWGRPAWRHWSAERALDQARAFTARGDAPGAILALQRATALAPGDERAWWEAERDLARLHSPALVLVRRRLAELHPAAVGLRVAWLATALRFRRLDEARTALEGFTPAARASLPVSRLAAEYDLLQGRWSDLRTQMDRIAAANPRDLDAAFSDAALRLWSARPEDAESARRELLELISEPRVRVRAAIELLTWAGRRRRQAEARTVLDRLYSEYQPGARPSYAPGNHAVWLTDVGGLERDAAGNAADVALLARWLAGMGEAGPVLAWIDALPAARRDAPAVADAAAEVCARAGDLDGLERRLRAGAWGPWPDGTLDLAIASRRAALAGASGQAGADWARCVDLCGLAPGALRNLARLAGDWHDDLGAYAVYERWSKCSPGDVQVAARWVTLGCLLGRTPPRLFSTADLLAPDSPTDAAACAAADWRRGRDGQALGALEALAPTERIEPEVAFWTAVVAADQGNLAACERALAEAGSVPRYGREKALLDQAAEWARVRQQASAGP